MTTTRPASFSLRSIAVPAFGPALLFSVGEGVILPVVALSARDLGASVAVAALTVTLIGLGSWFFNLPANAGRLSGPQAQAPSPWRPRPCPHRCPGGSGCSRWRCSWSAWPPASSAWPGRST
jgi:hypothetical protein